LAWPDEETTKVLPLAAIAGRRCERCPRSLLSGTKMDRKRRPHFDIAGIVQLEISGLFTHFLDKFRDEKKYPHGAPSYVTREFVAIDNPDTPIRTWFQNLFYIDKRVGFWLLVAGFFFQITANWL
jgi:hypothetical protein